jgi:hypothetical protein
LSVSVKVRTLENNMTEFSKKMTECETSCQGLSSLFDKADKQIKLNTRNLIHQDQRINALEKIPIVQPVVQPVTESNEIKRLRGEILDLKCCSMKNNLISSQVYTESQMKIQKICFDVFSTTSWESIIRSNLEMSIGSGREEATIGELQSW